jgi:hypothetical protein
VPASSPEIQLVAMEPIPASQRGQYHELDGDDDADNTQREDRHDYKFDGTRI